MISKGTVAKGIVWTAAAAGALYILKRTTQSYSKVQKVYAGFVKNAPARRWEKLAHLSAMNYRLGNVKKLAGFQIVNGVVPALPPLPTPHIPFQTWWSQQKADFKQIVTNAAAQTGLTPNAALTQIATGNITRVAQYAMHPSEVLFPTLFELTCLTFLAGMGHLAVSVATE